MRLQRTHVAERTPRPVDANDGATRAAGRRHATTNRVRPGATNTEREGAALRHRRVRAEGAPGQVEFERRYMDRAPGRRRAVPRRGDVRAAPTDGRHRHVRPARGAAGGRGGWGRVDAREEREGEVGAGGIRRRLRRRRRSPRASPGADDGTARR